ncbi:MAG: hypothetical protein Q9157_001911 [Trypethelium eluteriae]
MATKVSKSDAADDRDYDGGSGSNLSPPNESMPALDQSFNELALHPVPVSFQTRPELHPSARNRNRVEERPCEPREEHYNDSNKYHFQKGDFVRIWHPVNEDVHLITFLVIGVQGTNMTCLRIVHRDPEEVDFDFEKGHAKLKVEKYVPGASRRAPNTDSDLFHVVMNKSQDMVEHCWIDLLNSENIDRQKEYKFVRCGQLDDISLEKAKTEHLRLYAAKLR